MSVVAGSDRHGGGGRRGGARAVSSTGMVTGSTRLPGRHEGGERRAYSCLPVSGLGPIWTSIFTEVTARQGLARLLITTEAGPKAASFGAQTGPWNLLPQQRSKSSNVLLRRRPLRSL